MTATYAFRSPSGDIERMSHFGKPTPAHAQTPAAEHAREGVRAFAERRRLDRVAASLVTNHGNPHEEPYVVAEWRTTSKGKKKATGRMIPGGRPDAASRLARAAEAHGFKVNAFETPSRSIVEGIRGDVAFRATWHRGRAESGTWHERTTRYAMIRDTRPVGVSTLTRVALAKNRAAGVDEHHLSIVASPLGISVGVAEITKRVSST